MQGIIPHVWLDGSAEAAANYWSEHLPNTRIIRITHHDATSAAASGQDEGAVLTVSLDVDGSPLVVLNGGPGYTLTPALSLMIPCGDQAQLDRVWAGLADGGQPQACGWVTDRWGLSWQVTPAALIRMLEKGTPAQRQRVMGLLMTMGRIELAPLEAAFAAAG